MSKVAMASAVGTLEPEGPYAPCWVNVFTAWMERLPGPTWLACVAAISLAELVSVL